MQRPKKKKKARTDPLLAGSKRTLQPRRNILPQLGRKGKKGWGKWNNANHHSAACALSGMLDTAKATSQGVLQLGNYRYRFIS